MRCQWFRGHYGHSLPRFWGGRRCRSIWSNHAKVFISADGYVHGGKRHHIEDKARAIAARLPGLIQHFQFPT